VDYSSNTWVFDDRSVTEVRISAKFSAHKQIITFHTLVSVIIFSEWTGVSLPAQDGHDSFQLPSSFSASLGFTFGRYLHGKVLIDSVTRTGLPCIPFR
jgi:hypothetical protein